MATFLVAHGAWSAAWAWKKMRPLMRALGHELIGPTHTGLGERAHLAGPSIDLSTHIADICGVIEMEDLRDFILIGHSYGGMVATGVVDRLGDRVRHLVYLDAFAPRDGESAFDLLPAAARERMIEQTESAGEGWRLPPNPLPPDTTPEDQAWIMPRRLAQPIATFRERLRLVRGEPTLPRTYIYCRKYGPGDAFRRFADRARAEPGWRLIEMDASHNPHITAPEALAGVLHGIAKQA